MENTEMQKKQRKVLRCSFSKVANELDGLLKTEQPVKTEIEILWECLKVKFEELRICENNIYEGLLENATEDELIADMEAQDVYTKRFTELRVKCAKILETISRPDIIMEGAVQPENREEPPTGKRKFKLPQIVFKHYDGNIKDWLAFWSQFKKIHDDSEIDDSDKIEYLIQATVVGSRARQLVESFPARGENYENIVDCMKSRFGREDLQIEVYVRELLKLVLNNAMSQQKLDICKLYDQIETQLRALETLGITTDKYAAMLFPLIESSLPQDLLRIWQRSIFRVTATATSSGSSESVNADISLEIKLTNLMSFLRSEVENEQRISLASEGFGLPESVNHLKQKGRSDYVKGKPWEKIERSSHNIPGTAVDLVNTNVARCIFCSGSHGSDMCINAQKMNLDERKSIINNKKACFRCLKVGHPARKCRTRVSCIICEKPHLPLMCPDLSTNKQKSEVVNEQADNNVSRNQTLTNQTRTHVFLQTLQIPLKGKDGGCRMVRALIDTGSQRSYILTSTALTLGLKPKGAEKIVHDLFGGKETISKHYCYNITITGSSGKHSHTCEVLDQPLICNDVSPIFYGPWIQELESLKIDVSDFNNAKPIELLLGADIAALLHTGRRHLLQCGLVAIETYYGWTIMGKVSKPESAATMTVLSLFANPTVSDLWELDVLGIQGPTEKKTKVEMALAAKELFDQTVTTDEEGRYEVRLPWLEGHPPLPTNYNVAKKRLETTLRKLRKDELFERYDEVLREWLSLNIIKQVEEDKRMDTSYPIDQL